jgi:Tfp pilus assembly protein PilF
MKDPVRAEHHFRRSLEIDPAEYWSNLYLANLLRGLKRNEEAEQAYRHAIQLRPDRIGGVEFFARFLESIGKNAEAASERAKANLSDRFAAGV